jgi:hypothetical protein
MIFHFKKVKYEFDLDIHGRLWVGKGSVLDNPFLPMGTIPEEYVHVIKGRAELKTPCDAAVLYRQYTLPLIHAFIGIQNFKICQAATDYVCFCNEAGYCHSHILKHYFRNYGTNNIPNEPTSKSIFKKIEGRGNWRVGAQFLPTKHNQRGFHG